MRSREAGPFARPRAHAVALLVVLFAFGLSGVPASAAPGETLGAYAGSANTAGIAAFEGRLGRTVAHGHDFLDKRTWATMLDLSWLAQKWSAAGFANRLVLTVPMIPDEGGTLAQGAAGGYNAQFRTLAEKLVKLGHGSAILRLGPEFNGSWFPWTMNVPGGGARYAAYWRQIVTTMRSVPGASFKFDWCANAGSAWIAGGARQLEAADAWPGDDVVDYVGMDVYDQSWSADRADPTARWDEFVTQKNGMAWHAAFAAKHGKPMTFPEWGLVDRTDGMGGGDNPFFVAQMYRWIALHPVAYSLYFESRDPNAQYAVFSGRFPSAAQHFVAYFGPDPPAALPPPAPPPGTPLPPSAPPAGGGHWPPPPHTATGAAPAATVQQGDGTPVPAVSAGPPGGGRAARPLGRKDPAKLSIARARVLRRRARLDVLAPISRRASGAAIVALQSGGLRTRFVAPVDSARGELRIRRPIARGQARAGTGIVTITYLGDRDTQPQVVRLRAASRRAKLAAARPRITGGRLRAEGTISRRARGVVRTQITYTVAGVPFMRQYAAPIRHGRWTLDVALAPQVMREIHHRRGTLQSTTLFTGYLPARIGGEMRSFEVLDG